MTTTIEQDQYLLNATAENFDLDQYLARVVPDVRLLDLPAGRRALTELDPLLFGLVYTPHLIKLDDQFSFAELHLALCRYARTWITPAEPREARDSFIAPRNVGKSTWLFLILPLWAMAHQHKKFIAAFSSAGPQATKHLAGFKNELDVNDLLRTDFPDLCAPRKRQGGQSVADTQRMFYSKSQQTFFAAGLDEEILGLTDPMKRRPDLIILDDIEPDEANYSTHQATKRMISLRDTILPMNEKAHVALVGTVTMLGSLVHQLIQTVVEKEAPADWIVEERFRVHYFPPIIDGVRSIWPAKWPLAYLLEHQHERGYRKNFLNQPVSEGGSFWVPESFKYGTFHCSKWLIQIDPATTKKSTSDFYGIALIGYAPARFEEDAMGRTHQVEPPRCLVQYARAFRCTPAELRRRIIHLINVHPMIGRVRVEVNQGGDTWKEVLRGLPVRLLVHTESVKKDVRAADLLTHYDRDQVWHAQKLGELEAQMLSFPAVVHDDLVDAVGAGVRYFLEGKKKRAGVRRGSYVG